MSIDKPSDKLLRRGYRVATRMRAEVVAVYVVSEKLVPNQQKVVNDDIAIAAPLNIRVEHLEGRNIAQTLAEYAIKNQVTEIIIGHSHTRFWQELMGGSLVSRLIRLVRDIDVLVVAT
jgi:two-component system sensor histidine kinase KdpD